MLARPSREAAQYHYEPHHPCFIRYPASSMAAVRSDTLPLFCRASCHRSGQLEHSLLAISTHAPQRHLCRLRSPARPGLPERMHYCTKVHSGLKKRV